MDERTRSVGRVVAILDQLSVAPRPLSNLELGVALDVPLSSMHRLLQKLTALGYIDCEPDTACYSVAPKLSELGGRLADVGGYSEALRTLMGSIRDQTGYTVTVWMPGGAHVRISALLVGTTRGPQSRLPGLLAEPFSTPGVAIATQYTEVEIRKLVAMARRRRVRLGRGYKHIAQVKKAVEKVSQRGYATGFNMRSDGWGVLAWPIPITLTPSRYAGLGVSAPVQELRRRQDQLVRLVDGLRATYIKKLARQKK